jgi:hypothetical protein
VAIVSSPTRDQTPQVDHVLAFEGVIAFIHGLGNPVLPIRYGCVLKDEQSMTELLVAHHDLWLPALERVRGCVEIVVHLLIVTELPLTKQPEVTTGGGRAYLLARRGHYQNADLCSDTAEQIGAALCDVASGTYIDHQRSYRSVNHHERSGLLSCSFLLRVDQEKTFRETIRGFGERFSPKIKMLLSGPWAPYNFASNLKGVEDGKPKL